MAGLDVKAELHSSSCAALEVLARKLDGLGEYAIRWPLTRTGSRLIGLVEHGTTTHVGSFGEVFGCCNDALAARLSGEAGRCAEFGATDGESSEELVDDFRRAWGFADPTVVERTLDAVGNVGWCGDAHVPLRHIMVHATAETQRHAIAADDFDQRHHGVAWTGSFRRPGARR